MVSASPRWVKIGDFGLAKLARGSTAFRTEGGTREYVAPEAGIDTSRETSEYTNAIDIWALGCITHELLTQTLPFQGLGELSFYCLCPTLPRNTMLSKGISNGGIEFVKRALAYPPEFRIAAREALDLEWLRQEDEEVVEPGREGGRTSPALPERPASPRVEVVNRDPSPVNGNSRLPNSPAASMEVKDQRATGVILRGQKLWRGLLSSKKGPVGEVGYSRY